MNDQASRLYGVKKPVTAVADNESSNRRVENGRQMRMISEALQGVIELPNESFTGARDGFVQLAEDANQILLSALLPNDFRHPGASKAGRADLPNARPLSDS